MPDIFDDLANLAKPKKDNFDWIKQYMIKLQKSPPSKQVAIGGLSGWLSGFFVAKLGKTFIYGSGISIILLYIAQNAGYINLNTNKMEKDVVKMTNEIHKKMEKDIPQVVERVRPIIKDNSLIVLSYAGGFLLGMTLC